MRYSAVCCECWPSRTSAEDAREGRGSREVFVEAGGRSGELLVAAAHHPGRGWVSVVGGYQRP
eukprot:13064968-Alexandrium_andersonii.AAC.1